MIRLAGLVSLAPIGKMESRYASVVAEENEQPSGDVPDVSPDSNTTVDDSEGRMAKSDLFALHKQAGELYNMVGENDQLEGWVQSKITQAADYINAVYNAMQYEKSNATSVGAGDGTPADGQEKMQESKLNTMLSYHLKNARNK
jgi:hypothetical protein